MGVTFSLEHANIISYLISRAAVAPRVTGQQLVDFLSGLAGLHRTPDEGVKAFDFGGVRMGVKYTSDFGRWQDGVIIAFDAEWIERLRNAAQQRLAIAESLPKEAIHSSRTVGPLLEDLRYFFTGYSLCGLIVPKHAASEDGAAREFFEYAAISSRAYGIFLMPDRVDHVLSILDPFPQLHALAESPMELPVVAFWCPDGKEACVLPLAEARQLYENALRPALFGAPYEINQIIRDQNVAVQSRTGRIIHLSDFHFGERRSNLKRQYVKAHLKNIVRRNDRVVVTGDQTDTPNKDFYDEYKDFRSDIQDLTQHPLLAIPGNHDIRRMGNKLPWIGRSNYEWVTDIGWDPLVVDDDFECVFFCFNSIEEGKFARGSVSDDQLLRMSTAYEQEISKQRANHNPNFPNYLKVVLVHHHPFTYVTKPTTVYDRVLRRIFRSEDKFIRFDNADRFINWCGERGVSLMLHGHKHVPHHIRAKMTVAGKEQEIMVVSCGSTMGAEHSPLCYDIVSWSKTTNKWNVVFYEDRSTSGFKPQEIELDLR